MRKEKRAWLTLIVLTLLLAAIFISRLNWGTKTIIIHGVDAQERDYCGLEVVVCPGEEYTPPTPAYTEEELIIEEIKRVFGEEAELALAVAFAESRLNPDAVGDKHLSKPSYGLFQISRIYHPYSVDELLDWRTNIQVAKKISSRGRGWENWTTYREGHHIKFLNKAKKLL